MSLVNGLLTTFHSLLWVNDAVPYFSEADGGRDIFQFEGQATVFLPGHGCYRVSLSGAAQPGVRCPVAPRPGCWAWCAV